MFIIGKNVSLEDEGDIDTIINSTAYSKLFDEFLDHSKVTKNIATNTNLTKYHVLHDIEFAQSNEGIYRQAFLLELASQHFNGDMVPQIQFYGHGVHYGPGFSTDLSENCVWLTPFVSEPKDSSQVG